MKRKEMGKIPVNARITIDYSKEKPSIKFGYPRKDAIAQNKFNIPFLFLLIVWGIIFVLFMNSLDNIKGGTEISAPTECNFSYYDLEEYDLEAIDYIFLECNNYNYTLEFHAGKHYDNSLLSLNNYMRTGYPRFINYNSSSNPFAVIIYGILFVLIIFGSIALLIPIDTLLTSFLIKQKWYQKRMPEWNKKLHGRGYEAIFKEVPENKTIEIPLFKNIYLDYKATKQFSKYLKRVEIKEHPFNSCYRKKGKTQDKKKNVYLWSCKFYFSEIPKSGYLEVFFQ